MERASCSWSSPVFEASSPNPCFPETTASFCAKRPARGYHKVVFCAGKGGAQKQSLEASTTFCRLLRDRPTNGREGKKERQEYIRNASITIAISIKWSSNVDLVHHIPIWWRVGSSLSENLLKFQIHRQIRAQNHVRLYLTQSKHQLSRKATRLLHVIDQIHHLNETFGDQL